jgi:hypothetical protein
MLSPSHQMGSHLYLEVMTRLSSSGICRLVGLSRPSLVPLMVFHLLLSHQTLQQLPQDLVMDQFICGTVRQGSVFCVPSNRIMFGLLASLPQTLNTSYPYVITKSSSGTSMVTKWDLCLMVLMLLSLQMALSLLNAMGQLITVQNFRSGVIVAEFHVANGDTRYCCFSPDDRLIAVAAGNCLHLGHYLIQNLASLKHSLDILQNLLPCIFLPLLPHLIISRQISQVLADWYPINRPSYD